MTNQRPLSIILQKATKLIFFLCMFNYLLVVCVAQSNLLYFSFIVYSIIYYLYIMLLFR